MCVSHILDSTFYNKVYSTDEGRATFCLKRRLQRWLEIEAALAQAQAELGIIPQWAADEISRQAHLEYLDLKSIRKGIQQTGHSLVPLLRELQGICRNDAGEYIHYGATTQDIQDTGQVLEIKDILQIVERDVRAALELLMGLAERHRETVTIGRTHTQYALPMTLGLKFATWVDELWRGLERLHDCKPRVLAAELFGGVGTMDALSDQALELLDRFSNRLGLHSPLTCWHSSRDRTAELLTALAILSGTLGKIANEIMSLASSDVGELSEPFHMGQVSSSTMPHKRNPEMTEQIVTLSRLIRAAAGLGLEAIICEHERDYRSVRLEWVSVAEACLYTCGALNLTINVLEGLEVHEDRIRKNVGKTAELICSEALMFLLGKKIGKQTAHRVVYEITQSSISDCKDIVHLLETHPDVSGKFSPEEISNALDPIQHTGLSRTLTDRAVHTIRRKLNQLEPLAPITISCPLRIKEGCKVK